MNVKEILPTVQTLKLLRDKFSVCLMFLKKERDHIVGMLDSTLQIGNDLIYAIDKVIAFFKEESTKVETPVKKAVEPTAPVDINITLRKHALAKAQSKIGVKETTGNNDGPEVNLFQKLSYLLGKPWCMAFVSWCFENAAKEVGVKMPFAYEGSVGKFVEVAKKKGWVVRGEPQAGQETKNCQVCHDRAVPGGLSRLRHP